MDVKSRLVLIEQIAEHFVEVHLSQDIPLGILHTALVNILTDVTRRINEAAPKLAPAAEPSPDVAPIVEAQTEA